jgi:gamma-glutamyltranspeptidase
MLFAGDPDFEHLDVSRLLDPVRLSARRRALSLERTRSLPAMAAEEHGTHHIVVADAHSNVVSLTTTVNNAFGAKLEDERTGIILNDQLDDFTARAAVGSLGLAESPNRARPGARPISSMTPTIVVKDGAPELAIGGSGGMAISVNVAEVLLARLVYGMSPEAAVAAPRFGVPLEGSTISLDAPIPREVWTDLERRGETVSERTTSHAVQLIAIDSRGRKTPAADQRKSGVALAE